MSLPRVPLSAALLTALVVGSCGSGRGATPAAPPERDGSWYRREPWRPAEPEPEAPMPTPKEPDLDPAEGGRPPAPPAVLPPADPKVVAWLPGPSSDTLTLRGGERDYRVTDTLVQASARTAFMAYQGGGPYVGTTFRNTVVRVEPGTVPDGRSYWGLRGFDMVDTVLEGVEITGFGRVTPHHDEGHAVYFNLAGALTVTDSHLHHNGGQALQLVNRSHESKFPGRPAAGRVTIRRSAFEENGFNPDRGAFQVSIFGTGQDVLLEDVRITAGHDATSYPKGQTGGGLLVEPEYPVAGRGNCWWLPADPPKDFTPPFTNGTVELRRVRVDHVDPGRPIVQIKGCRELTVSDSEFRGGQVNLDDPTKPGRPSGRIVWRGNRGDARVRLGGRDIGPADRDFVAVDGVLE